MTLTVAGPEARTYPAEFRADKGSKFFEVMAGRAVPYGVEESIGWFIEVHEAGSFKKTIRENPNLPLLLFHDARRFPVGRVEKWDDREDGLHAVWALDTSDDAQEAARLASDRMLTGLSIGFAPIRTMWEDRDGVEVAHRQESRLLEVSLTPVPAFAGASVEMVRSRDLVEGHSTRGRPPVRTPMLDMWRARVAGLL